MFILNSNLKTLLIVKRVTANAITVKAGESTATMSVDTTLNNYKTIGIVGYNLTNIRLMLLLIRPSEKEIQYSMRNIDSYTDVTVSPEFYVLYIKNFA